MIELKEAPPADRAAPSQHALPPIHLDRFDVVHYRGLDGLEMTNLAPVNLITGGNGVGKTSLLEAVWLFHGRYHAELLWNTHLLRLHGPVVDPVASLSDGGVITLEGEENGSRRTFSAHLEKASPPPADNGAGTGSAERLHVPVVGILRRVMDGSEASAGWAAQPTPEGQILYRAIEPPRPRPGGVFLNATREMGLMEEELGWFSDVVRQGRRDEIARVTRLVAPEVLELQLLMGPSKSTYLSAILRDGGDRPVQVMGAGVVRLCRLLFGCYAARGGILLVDELENGLHHSILPQLWKQLRTLSEEWSVQLFVTTHSGECLDAVMETFEDAPEALAIHNLYRRQGRPPIGAATFSGETLEGAVSLNLELR